MFKKENRINKKEIEEIFKNGKKCYSNFIGIRFVKNNYKLNRFTIVIGSKIYKLATERNKTKRQIREFLKKNTLNQGFDIVIFLFKKTKNINQIKQEIVFCLKKEKLTK